MFGSSSPSRGRTRGGLVTAIAVIAVLYFLFPETFLGVDHKAPAVAERPSISLDTQGPVPEATTTTLASGLHPGLVSALERATDDASELGLAMLIASGYRSVEEQLVKLADAIEKHGSREVAEKWVFPPDRSMHVRGLAVDIGDGPSADWLKVHGYRYGLCQTLSWEWWHFEWRESWESSQTCPGVVDDPAHAPPPDGGWGSDCICCGC